MSKSINKRHVCVLSVTIVLALILCIFRLYLLRNCIEPKTGFYIVGTELGTYFNVAFVLALVAIAAGVLFSKVRVLDVLSSESTAVVFSSSLCGFLFATVLVCGAYEVLTAKNNEIFFVLELLFCIPSIFNFFCVCAKENREKGVKNVILGVAPAVFYAIRTIHVFTDTQTQINTSQRSLALVMYCGMMLLFVQEAYFFIPDYPKADAIKEKKSVSFKYGVLTLIVMTLAVVVALPYIAVSAFWVYESKFLLMDVLDLCVGIYALTRAVTLCGQ